MRETDPTPERGSATPGDGRVRLARLADRYWCEYLRDEPITATELGSRDWDDRVPDWSPEGKAARLDRLRRLAAEVEALPLEQLEDPEDRVTRAELLARIRAEQGWLGGSQCRYLDSRLMAPQNWVLRLPDIQPLRTTEEAQAFRARVAAVPELIRGVVEAHRSASKAGVRNVSRRVRASVESLDRLVALAPEDWALVRHAASFSEDEGERVRVLVVEDLVPAFTSLREVLGEELLPRSRGDQEAGLCHLPDGEQEYARSLRWFVSRDVDPRELHQHGLELVRSTREELEELASDQLGCVSLGELQSRLEEDPALHFSSADEILGKARGALKEARARLGEITSFQLAAECRVLPVPELSAPGAQEAYYTPPASDGSVPGTCYLNTHAPETRRRFTAELLAFHEGIPGHHLQTSVAQTLALPGFRRLGGVPGFCEGWALYAEGLAGELGFFSEEVERLGLLLADLWRCVRVVLDTGVHALGWTRDRALAYAQENCTRPRERMVQEFERYLAIPGQAVSYKVGQLEILELRGAEVERRGDTFSLAGFHDRILGGGALHLTTLRQRFEEMEVGAIRGT